MVITEVKLFAGTPNKELNNLLDKSFTTHMALLTAKSAFGKCFLFN